MRYLMSLLLLLGSLPLVACGRRGEPPVAPGTPGQAPSVATATPAQPPPTPPAGTLGGGLSVHADMPAACLEPATKIHAVQGSGPSSPLRGALVTIQGVVVGDFQKNDGDEPFATDLGGYAVQEEDADVDDDPLTSEGIYVHDSNIDVAVGDLVRVSGRVAEQDGLTQLTNVTDVIVCAERVELPTPARVLLPVAATDDLEAYEGMLVTFPQELVISEHHDFDRYGELVLMLPPSDAERPYQPTSRVDPTDPEARALTDLWARSRIVLDDGRAGQNPDPARHPAGSPFSLENAFRSGDRLSGVTGVLDYAFGAYRVQPTRGAAYVQANPRPEAPDVGGGLRVVGFNAENYFEDFGNACGPRGTAECRGAKNAAELQRQRAKLVAAIMRLDPHVLALMEVENDPDEGALNDLVEALNAAAGAPRYAPVSTGPIGRDAIRVALVYQPAAVTPVGAPAVLDDPAFVNPRKAPTDRNRPALAQTFAQEDGATFTVVVNHFKSKGSPCGRGDDDAVQGNCNRTRTLAAQALMAWLARDPTGSGDPDFLLLGDYNSYAREQPVRAVEAGFDGVHGTADDLTDLLEAFAGPGAYTYVFDGQVGSLDYAFATPSLLTQVTGAAAWHINADEPDLIGYPLAFKTPAMQALFTPDPYRSSDHDPVVVGLTLTR